MIYLFDGGDLLSLRLQKSYKPFSGGAESIFLATIMLIKIANFDEKQVQSLNVLNFTKVWQNELLDLHRRATICISLEAASKERRRVLPHAPIWLRQMFRELTNKSISTSKVKGESLKRGLRKK